MFFLSEVKLSIIFYVPLHLQMLVIVALGAGWALATADATLAEAGVPGWVCPYAQLGVATNTPVGPRAGRAAECLVDASSVLAPPGVEGPFAEDVKGYARQTTLRSAAWPKDEKRCTVAFVDNKTQSK